MLQDILGLVTKVASSEVQKNDNVSNDNMGAIAEMAFKAIAGGLSSNAAAGNTDGIANLLSGGAGVSSSNPLVSGIQQTVVSSISEKLGINPSIANGLASSIIPKVMEAISGKVNDPNDQGFNVESVLGAFTGHSDNKQGGGGLMDLIGGFLGGK